MTPPQEITIVRTSTDVKNPERGSKVSIRIAFNNKLNSAFVKRALLAAKEQLGKYAISQLEATSSDPVPIPAPVKIFTHDHIQKLESDGVQSILTYGEFRPDIFNDEIPLGYNYFSNVCSLIKAIHSYESSEIEKGNESPKDKIYQHIIDHIRIENEKDCEDFLIGGIRIFNYGHDSNVGTSMLFKKVDGTEAHLVKEIINKFQILSQFIRDSLNSAFVDHTPGPFLKVYLFLIEECKMMIDKMNWDLLKKEMMTSVDEIRLPLMRNAKVHLKPCVENAPKILEIMKIISEGDSFNDEYRNLLLKELQVDAE